MITQPIGQLPASQARLGQGLLYDLGSLLRPQPVPGPLGIMTFTLFSQSGPSAIVAAFADPELLYGGPDRMRRLGHQLDNLAAALLGHRSPRNVFFKAVTSKA